MDFNNIKLSTVFAATAGIMLVGGLAATGAIFQTQENERHLVLTGGEINRVTEPGWNVMIPVAQQKVRYPTDQQKTEIRVGNTATLDKQVIEKVELTLLYRIPTDMVTDIHTNARDYHDILTQLATNVHNEILGTINTTDLTNNREDINKRQKDALQNAVEGTLLAGIDIDGLLLTNFEWSSDFATSLEQTMTEKNEVEREKARLEKAKIMADNARAVAEGERDAQKIRTDGQAYEISETGKAQADALKEQVNALGGAESLVDLEKTKRWNGDVPDVVSGGDGGNGLLIDLRGKDAGAIDRKP
jgi:regulator of protease activity HflC (stomatin/prohibitin superfamily)